VIWPTNLLFHLFTRILSFPFYFHSNSFFLFVRIFRRVFCAVFAIYHSFCLCSRYGDVTRGWMVRFPVKARYFYVLHSVQTDCGPKIAPYSRETRYLSPGGEWTGSETDLSLLVLRLRLSGVRPPHIRLYGVYTDFRLTLTFTCTLHLLPLSFQFLCSLIIFSMICFPYLF